MIFMRVRVFAFVFAVLIVSCFCTNTAKGQEYNNGVIDKTIATIGGEFILLSQIE